jgi:hypothetical protein
MVEVDPSYSSYSEEYDSLHFEDEVPSFSLFFFFFFSCNYDILWDTVMMGCDDRMYDCCNARPYDDIVLYAD